MLCACTYHMCAWQYCKNTANVMSVSSDFVEMRERVFRLLKGTGFRAVVFNQVSG